MLNYGLISFTADRQSGNNYIVNADERFHLKIEKRTIDYVECVKADYLLVASGSIKQVVFCRMFFDIVDCTAQISFRVIALLLSLVILL